MFDYEAQLMKVVFDEVFESSSSGSKASLFLIKY